MPRYFCFGDVCPLTACGLFSRQTDINGQKVVLRQLLAVLWYKQRPVRLLISIQWCCQIDID